MQLTNNFMIYFDKLQKRSIQLQFFIKIISPFEMGLEIQPELFKWLQTLSIIKEGKRNPNNLIELNQQTTAKLFDGIYIGNILKNHVFKDDQQMKKKLESIKQNSTPAIRLYNWNILTEAMKRLKFTIDYAQKSKILNLEQQPLLKVLKHIYNSQKTADKISVGNPLQVDITQVSKKSIKDSNNILQLFVVSISKNFKLSPQHTLNLFLDNNKYLSHLLVKGVKNSYQPIYAFLNDIRENLDYIIVTLFCTDQRQSVNFFLNGLKPCIISKDFQVAERQLQILNDVINTYKMNSMSVDQIKKWMKDDGINTLFFGMKRHPDLFEQILKFTYEIIEQELFSYIQPVDKSVLWTNDKEKIQFYYTFLCCFGNQKLKKFESTECCAAWYKFCVKIAKKSKDTEQMYLVMKIFEISWLHMPQSFHNQQSDLPNLYLGFLKNASVSNSQLMYNQSVRIMFSLMQILGDRKNSNAPLLYKILTNCFSFHSDETRITFLAENFIEAFKSISNLPGGPIIDPLIKSLQRDPKLQCLQLSFIMLQQRRITQNQIIQLMEIYTRIVFHDVRYGSFCLQYLFDTLRSIDPQLGYQFLQRNSQLSLALYFSICKSITKSVSDIKSDIKRYGQQGLAKRGDNKNIEQLAKHINLGNIVQFLKSAIYFSQELKEFLQSHIFHTYVRIANELKKKKQAELLQPLLKSYFRMQNQLEERIKQYEYEQNPPPVLQISDQMPSPKNKGKSRTLVEEQQQPKKTLDSSMLKPARSAIKDLQKLRKKKQQIKTLEHKHQKELDLIESKKQMVRSIINQKRVIQFGSKSKNNMQYNCIFDFDSQKQEENILGLPLIRMLNLSKDIEDPFVEDADSIMKKFRKVWRFLFFKYSTFGAGKKQQFKVEEKINIAEIWKMLKQYQIGIVKKQQSHALVRQVNDLMKRKNDLQNLTYLGFQEYLVQLCNYGYGKTYGHVPIGQQIRLFINQVKKITSLKGGNIDIFENPQEVYFQETQVIKQFNKRLLQNPQYILPEGYKKMKLNELNYTYQVHPLLQKNISSSYIDVLEVMDDIFSEKLGFRILEPLTHKMEKVVAKPALFQKLNDKMKDYKGGYLAPKRQITTAKVREKQENKIIVKPEFHPLVNFSLGIKIGLANVGIKDRYIADQVAYWVDDMLDAIQKGSNIVQNKAKRKIQNQALKNKSMAIRMLRNLKKEQQQKYKKRAESVKVQVSENKKVIQQKEVEKRQKKRKERLDKKAKQQRQLKKKVQQFQKAKQKLNEQRQAKKQKLLQQQKAKKQQKQQYKKGVQQYFRKKKQEIEEKQLTLKKQKDDKQSQQKKDKEKKQKMFKNLHYSILKREQKTLEKVSEVKQVYEDVWQSETIQKEISNYELPLKHLFDLLLKHQKSKISATSQDEISLNTIHFFALKFKIVPFMIQKNALVKMFKIVSRISNKSATLGVNFDEFKQLMFRIAVKSKDLLNGIIDKKKKKQQQYSKFFSKQSNDGNHFEVEDISENLQNQLSQSKMTKQKPDITDEYLFDATGVTGQTMKQMFDFLSLPRDKQGVQEKYRQMLQSKNNKPKNILIKELKNSLE